MKLYRYMSNEEFRLLTAGVPLSSNVNHSRHARSGSVGYCFLAEKTEFENYEGEQYVFSPMDCIEFLSGIVTNDVLVEIEVKEQEIRNFIREKACYADPTTSEWYKYIVIEEYSTTEYSLDTVTVTRYAVGNTWYQWA